MFLLNPCIKDSVIINIIGQDQSEHIKKVLQVKKDNNLDLNVMFLTYNICKSAASRNLEEWSEILYNIIETNNIQIDDEKIEAFDFLRLFYFLPLCLVPRTAALRASVRRRPGHNRSKGRNRAPGSQKRYIPAKGLRRNSGICLCGCGSGRKNG